MPVSACHGGREVMRWDAGSVTYGRRAFLALAARDVPVLFAISGDPVELGIVEQPRPPRWKLHRDRVHVPRGGRQAGRASQAGRARSPDAGGLSNVDHPGEVSERRATEAAAAALGMRVAYAPFSGAGELDTGLGIVRAARADAMIVFPDGATMVNRMKIARFAVAERLPSMFGWSEFADAGG